jgi:arginine utilization regulatory protein
MEQDLREMAEMLKAILGSIDEGIHAVNREGISIYYNEVAARLDGLRPEEVIGKHVLEVFPSLMNDTSTLLKVIETGEAIYHKPQTYTNFRGRKVHTVNTTLPIRSQGRVIGALEVSRDLTRVKELTEKLLDLQAKLLASPAKRTDRSPMQVRYTFDDILTRNEQMKRLKDIAKRAASTSSPILVYGETGTGKELFVQAIHHASPRKNKPFIAQNCAALPASLLEGILFGTVKGSFTGAENRPGLFELAHEGTLFLDELNSMPLELQAKLLRVLQDGCIRRVGDTKVIPVDVRIIAATNANPLAAVEQGMIRADLYYRVNVVSLQLPPLRERKEDIGLLIQHFIDDYNHRFGLSVKGVSPTAEKLLLSYDWPGNVRELEHAIEGAMNQVSDDLIEVEHLPWQIVRKAKQETKDGNSFQAGTNGGQQVNRRMFQENDGHEPTDHREERPRSGHPDSFWQSFLKGRTLRAAVQEVEQYMIRTALQETRGNVQRAAKLLGIPRQTLQYKLDKIKGNVPSSEISND